MATRSRLLGDRPIQPRNDDSEVYVSDGESTGESHDSRDSPHESESDADVDPDGAQDTKSQDDNDDDVSATQSAGSDQDDLKNISFGALAKAQATFAGPPRSRKRRLSATGATEQPVQRESDTRFHSRPSRDDDIENRHIKKSKQDLTPRTSKHAPTVLSSRKPVSRKRSIISPPPQGTKSRDPRFDPTVTTSSSSPSNAGATNKAYSFLTAYQADEILTLKSEIKRSLTTDPQRADELKRKVTSMESRLRAAETLNRERDLVRAHNAQQKKAIREGSQQRPYFLKKSEVRREVERERTEGLGRKQKDKKEKRTKSRQKTKEARDMPWSRRTG